MSTFARSRARGIAYWIITSLVALEVGVGGIMDLLRTEHVRVVVSHLGYPLYVLTILGLWKIPGAAMLLIPRFPRLREWAYAGIFFEMTGAAFSHALFHDPGYFAITLTFALLTLASRMLERQYRTQT
jgi:uncharacterized membrane protein YphA (DoxX/SURF4 family)